MNGHTPTVEKLASTIHEHIFGYGDFNETANADERAEMLGVIVEAQK